MSFTVRIATLLLGGFVSLPAAAEMPWQYFGDVRAGIFVSEREARNGDVTRNESLRMRLRAGAERRLAEDWVLRGRLAARLTTDQDGMRFWDEIQAPSRTGLEDGDVTLDELYLRFEPSGAAWSLRLGRFQSKFALSGVASKSLDRNDSPNVDTTWTDGLHWSWRVRPQWRTHLVLQGNTSEGSGQTARAPLSFDDSASRVTGFAAVEATTPWGPVTQRLLAITWMPSTLATAGLDEPARDDYLTITAKLFAEWPIGGSGMRGGLGGEIGHAPNTPRQRLYDPQAGGDADGAARQFSMNLWDFAPGHHLAFVYGRAGAGWLISPDFRNNDRLLEIRYQWRISRAWSLETRLRRREEITVPADAPQRRIDDDFYLRFTGRW